MQTLAGAPFEGKIELQNKKEYTENNFSHPSLMESSTTKGFLLGAGLIVLLVLAFIAGGYFYNPNEKAKNEPQQPAAITKTTPASPAAQAQTPVQPDDKRQLISSATEYEQQYILDTFLGKFNTSPATTNFTYTNAQKGIELVLPWNPLWGTSAHKIAQYETTKNGINFGFIEVCGEGAGCLWREFNLAFLPAKSLAEEKKARASADMLTEEVLSINGFTVLYTGYDGMCPGTAMTVIGKKYNYEFGSACGLSDEQITKLKKIIATIKFI